MATSISNLQYYVDVVFAIDVTGSMGSLINTVKNRVINFLPQVRKTGEEKGKSISHLRVKVIPFRNYQYDGNEAVTESRWFCLDSDASEEDALRQYVNGLEARGGSLSREQGFRENSLEALATAIRTDWSKDGQKRRHIICLFSDVEPLALEEGREYAGGAYPADMPASFDELTDLWEGQGSPIENTAKRLCLFVPECDKWAAIGDNWSQTTWWPAKAGEGLQETDETAILSAIMNSI